MALSLFAVRSLESDTAGPREQPPGVLLCLDFRGAVTDFASRFPLEHRELAPHECVALLLDIEEVLGVKVGQFASMLTCQGPCLRTSSGTSS